MNTVTRKMIGLLVGAHALGILIIVVADFIWQGKGLVPGFVTQWHLSNAVVQWIDFFVPISLSGIALAFTVLINPLDLRRDFQGARSFVRIAGGSVGLFIILTAIYIVLLAFAYGPSELRAQQAVDNSQRARDLYASAQKEASDNRLADAISSLDTALKIAPNYGAASDLRDQLGSREDAVRAGLSGNAANTPPVQRPSPKVDLGAYVAAISSAQAALAKEDYFSALYYVQLAEGLVARPDPSLVALRAKVELGLSGGSLGIKDQQKQQLYDIKQSAIVGNLQSSKPIEAYYLLLQADALARKAGMTVATAQGDEYADPDVRRWMPVVLAQLTKVAFFTDEIDPLLKNASSGSLMFLNQAATREYLYARGMVPGSFTYYLIAPEYIRLDRDGKIVVHVKAPYGKIVGTNLILKSIDRKEPTLSHEADALLGTLDPVLKNILPLTANPDVLWGLSQGGLAYKSMTFPSLLSLLPIVSGLGYDPLPVQAALLDYLVKALSLSSLAFFVMAWSWANRSRYLTRPGILTALVLILVPIVAILFSQAYYFVFSEISAGILILGGFGIGIVLVLVLQGVQLALSLVYVAGQSSE